jgi:hypothetical protein
MKNLEIGFRLNWTILYTRTEGEAVYLYGWPTKKVSLQTKDVMDLKFSPKVPGELRIFCGGDLVYPNSYEETSSAVVLPEHWYHLSYQWLKEDIERGGSMVVEFTSDGITQVQEVEFEFDKETRKTRGAEQGLVWKIACSEER